MPDHAGLDAKDVPGLASDRHRPGAAQTLPQALEVPGSGPEVVPLLAALLAPDDADWAAVERHRDVVVDREVRERLTEDLLQRLAGGGTGDGEDARLLARVLELDLLRDEEPVERRQGRADELAAELQHQAIREAVHGQEGDDLPVDVEECGLAPLAGLERLDVVGEHALEEARPVAARRLDLAALRAVDQAGALAHGLVLAGGIPVSERHEAPVGLAEAGAE